jgi:hypothetical protein
MDRPGGISRGYATWLLYLVFSCMAFLLNGLGAVLAPLQKELGVTRGEVAFYPSLFAVGLLVVGLAGGSFVSRIGRVAALRLSVAGMMLGGLLIAVAGRDPSRRAGARPGRSPVDPACPGGAVRDASGQAGRDDW